LNCALCCFVSRECKIGIKWDNKETNPTSPQDDIILHYLWINWKQFTIAIGNCYCLSQSKWSGVLHLHLRLTLLDLNFINFCFVVVVKILVLVQNWPIITYTWRQLQIRKRKQTAQRQVIRPQSCKEKKKDKVVKCLTSITSTDTYMFIHFHIRKKEIFVLIHDWFLVSSEVFGLLNIQNLIIIILHN